MVKDFRWSEDDPQIRLLEKGETRRNEGIHHQAATSIQHYIDLAGLKNGPLFRPRLNPRSKKLASRGFGALRQNHRGNRIPLWFPIFRACHLYLLGGAIELRCG